MLFYVSVFVAPLNSTHQTTSLNKWAQPHVPSEPPSDIEFIKRHKFPGPLLKSELLKRYQPAGGRGDQKKKALLRARIMANSKELFKRYQKKYNEPPELSSFYLNQQSTSFMRKFVEFLRANELAFGEASTSAAETFNDAASNDGVSSGPPSPPPPPPTFTTIKQHSTSGMFQCPHVGCDEQQINRLDNLKRHYLTHGPPLFKCAFKANGQVCQFAKIRADFVAKHYYKEHMKRKLKTGQCLTKRSVPAKAVKCQQEAINEIDRLFRNAKIEKVDYFTDDESD